MITNASLKGILCVIAALLAVNVAVMLARPEAASAQTRALGELPVPVQASGLIRMEGSLYVTTNETGDVLHVWQLGPFTGERIRSVRVDTYPAEDHRGR